MKSDFGVASQKKPRHGDASCLIYILSALQIASTRELDNDYPTISCPLGYDMTV
jgi:hypothetical protein